MADAISGFLRGARDLGAALGNYAQTTYSIERDKENRAIAEEERAYRREQDKQALKMKQDYLDIAKDDRAYRRRKDELETNMRAFKDIESLSARVNQFDSAIAQLESKYQGIPNVDVKLSPQYRDLIRQRDEARNVVSRYITANPNARKFATGLAMSAAGNDAEANFLAKANGMPARFNNGSISLMDADDQPLGEVNRQDALATLGMVDGVKGLTFDPISKSFFDTATTMRYDIEGDTLAPGEKYKRWGTKVFDAYEGGMVNNEDLESLGINLTEGGDVVVPKVNSKGEVTGSTTEKMSPEAFERAEASKREIAKARESRIKEGIQAKSIIVDPQGNVRAAKTPEEWDNLTSLHKNAAFSAIDRLLATNYVNKKEVRQELDDKNKLVKSLVTNKIEPLRTIGATEIGDRQNALGWAHKTEYDRALAEGASIEEATRRADEKLLKIVPDVNAALKEQLKDKTTKTPKKTQEDLDREADKKAEALKAKEVEELSDKEFLEELNKGILEEIGETIADMEILGGLKKIDQAMTSRFRNAVGGGNFSNMAKKLNSKRTLEDSVSILRGLKTSRVMNELTGDQRDLFFNYLEAPHTEGAVKSPEFDRKLKILIKTLDKAAGPLNIKAMTKAEFQDTPYVVRAMRELKEFLDEKLGVESLDLSGGPSNIPDEVIEQDAVEVDLNDDIKKVDDLLNKLQTKR